MGEFFRVGSDLSAAMTGNPAAQPAEGITYRDANTTKHFSSVGGPLGMAVESSDADGVSALVHASQLERITQKRDWLVEQLQREPVDASGSFRDPVAASKWQRQITEIEDTYKFQVRVAEQQMGAERAARAGREAAVREELELANQVAEEKRIADIRKRVGG